MRLIPPNQPPSSKHDGPAGAGLQHPQHRQLLLHLQSLPSVVISNVDEALNIRRDHTFSTTTHTPPSTTPSPTAAGAHPELLFIINILNITSFPESTPSSIWRLPPWTAMMACPVACPMPHTTCHPHPTPCHTTPHRTTCLTPHHTTPHPTYGSPSGIPCGSPPYGLWPLPTP